MPSPGLYEILEGTEVVITANPYPDYEFIGWYGDIESSDRTIKFTIQKNTSVIAGFDPVGVQPDPNPDNNSTLLPLLGIGISCAGLLLAFYQVRRGVKN